MSNKEKYLKKLTTFETDAISQARERASNREWLRRSKKIALHILLRLDELGWTQKNLAENLEVSPQYVAKLLKGNEKFGFDILDKIERKLSMPIFANFVNISENKSKKIKTEGKIVFYDFTIRRNEKSLKKSYTSQVIPLNEPSEYYELEEVKEN